MTEYRIEYQIQRRSEGDDDFAEIGFGSSGGCDSTDAAAFAVESYVVNGQWETEAGQPDPEDVLSEIAKEADRG